ncbi:hypothetical protein Tco_1093520 [Tanacetum coccineum]|uniref:Uncharacterized protein n=1 Tax=Tanacetum coccineum TaxID=301880 RepID=A0ABQ5IFC4_9ASTR
MSTSNVHQQSLADASSETRPPMLERVIPTGSVMVPTGSVMVPTGSVMVPTGSVMVPTGSVMVMVTPGIDK